jgi:hypothetical protein
MTGETGASQKIGAPSLSRRGHGLLSCLQAGEQRQKRFAGLHQTGPGKPTMQQIGNLCHGHPSSLRGYDGTGWRLKNSDGQRCWTPAFLKRNLNPGTMPRSPIAARSYSCKTKNEGRTFIRPCGARFVRLHPALRSVAQPIEVRCPGCATEQNPYA